MKTHLSCFGVVLALCLQGHAGTTINATNTHGYSANAGWMNWRGDGGHGAVIGQYFCTGYVWSANAGWVCLGNGPTNLLRYTNAGNDWGVNNEGDGRLRGYAYGANIGWINFESNGNARVDQQTGILSGHAWGANMGWISLSNTFAYVQTDVLHPGPDGDADGVTDPWEIDNFGNLAQTGAGDPDRDGLSNSLEQHRSSDPQGRMAPDWWAVQGLVNTNLTAHDHATLNAGQLKAMAAAARQAMDASLPGGAGPVVDTLVDGFAGSNNFNAINLGQLKAVATPFYLRLMTNSLADRMPWQDASVTNDYAAANQGQGKHLFSFDVDP